MEAGKKMRMEPLVLRPSQAEVLGTSFEDYITKHETRILKAGGICKIVMPASLNPRRAGYENLGNIIISRAIRQHAQGSRGLYHMVYVEQKPMHINEFKAIALNKENLPSTSGEGRSGNTDDVDLERKFWKNIGIRPPLYGADVEGSLFDEKAKGWNLRRLDTLLSNVLEESGHRLPGVNTPYLYFGQWRSCFAWHTEDLDLYSVNYLHFGAPKQWYVIPPEYSKRLEYVIKAQVPELFKLCPEYLRHKELLVSPQFLEQYQIPYVRVTQHPREFVITYPGAYHAGFNQGFNCAESVNFATKRWIPIGARAGVCTCQSDSVKIDMRLFRHLVPKSQLPEELLHDTSDEEDSDASDGSSDDNTDASDSDDSTTESLAATNTSTRKRPRSAGPGTSTKAAMTSSRSKRIRGVDDTDVAQAGKRQQVQTAAAVRKAVAREHTGDGEVALAAMRVQQADARRARAAARSGRPSVRERVQLRLAIAVRPSLRHLALPTSPTSGHMHTPAAPASRRPAAARPHRHTDNTTQTTAPVQRPAPARGARVLQSRAQTSSPTAPQSKARSGSLTTHSRPARAMAAPAPRNPTAAIMTRTAVATTAHPVTRHQRQGAPPTQQQARTTPRAAAAAAAAAPPSAALVSRRGRPSRSSTEPSTEAKPSTAPLTVSTRPISQRRPRTAPAPAVPAPIPHTVDSSAELTNTTNNDDGTSNTSGASHLALINLPLPVVEVPTIRTRPRTVNATAAVQSSPASPNPLTSPRPRRANAGVNKWLTAGSDFEVDDTKWQPEEPVAAAPSPTPKSVAPTLATTLHSTRGGAGSSSDTLRGVASAGGDAHLTQRLSSAISPRQTK